jgi:hypothetical protein
VIQELDDDDNDAEEYCDIEYFNYKFAF